MRRLLLVLTVALVMAAMVVATAAPVFAAQGCPGPPKAQGCGGDVDDTPGDINYRGGHGGSANGSGGGAHVSGDLLGIPGYPINGGMGSGGNDKGSGGGGGGCFPDPVTGEQTCGTFPG
jgi:hypothetical protein